MEQWQGFNKGVWTREVNVRDFILKNFSPYEGDDSFITGATEATNKLWAQVMDLTKQERENGGVLEMDTETVSTITSHGPGYLDEELEKVVGVQTDKPFNRSLQPFGGIRMAKQACEAYGYQLNPEIERIFTDYRKTHNQGVFDAYTDEMKLARKSGIVTGLPDAYGRGRIIGDYRRVALYGIDYLIEEKKKDLDNLKGDMLDELVRKREEVSEQIRALNAIKSMAARYGIDISKPASRIVAMSFCEPRSCRLQLSS